MEVGLGKELAEGCELGLIGLLCRGELAVKMGVALVELVDEMIGRGFKCAELCCADRLIVVVEFCGGVVDRAGRLETDEQGDEKVEGDEDGGSDEDEE